MRPARRAIVAAYVAAAAFASITVIANADPNLLSPNEERWLGHLHSVLGLKFPDVVEAVSTGYQLCHAALTAPDADTGIARMDAVLSHWAQPPTAIPGSAVESLALNVLCPSE